MEEQDKLEKRELTNIQKIILYFFVYAILGWILETIFCLVTTGNFTKRGFLYGPLCPIYGFGAVILIECLRKIKTTVIGKFFISMIAFTIFEYIVSLILENIFGLRWWDYSNEPFNFQGRISLGYSIAWGILGTIFVQNIHPYLTSKIEPLMMKLSNKVRNVILYGLSLIALTDFVFSILKYINI